MARGVTRHAEERSTPDRKATRSLTRHLNERGQREPAGAFKPLSAATEDEQLGGVAVQPTFKALGSKSSASIGGRHESICSCWAEHSGSRRYGPCTRLRLRVDVGPTRIADGMGIVTPVVVVLRGRAPTHTAMAGAGRTPMATAVVRGVTIAPGATEVWGKASRLTSSRRHHGSCRRSSAN